MQIAILKKFKLKISRSACGEGRSSDVQFTPFIKHTHSIDGYNDIVSLIYGW